MSTGEAVAVSDVSGASSDGVASAPAKKAKAKTPAKAKGGNSKGAKEPKEAKSPKPPKVAASAGKNGSAKTPAIKAAAAKTVTRSTQDRAIYRAAADLLKMAGDATRVAVLLILANCEQNVTELCGHLASSQPAVSHHLALLRHGGLIIPTRSGKNNIYALTPKGVALAESIQRVCETGI